MNQTLVKSMEFHFRRLYLGQPTINIEQLANAIKTLPNHQNNHFVTYSIRSKVEDKENPDDTTTFPELMKRIQTTFKDTKDIIYLENYFDLIDEDSDGIISYIDIEKHSQELGSICMSQKAYNQLCQKLTHQANGLSKHEFLDIMREYL